MLIITRKISEKVIMSIPEGVSGQVEVMIVKVDRGQVRLGIEAPRAVSIFRDELPPLPSSPPAPHFDVEGALPSGRFCDDITDQGIDIPDPEDTL